MAQFVAYENPNKATKNAYPYLLDIQSNLLDDLRTTNESQQCFVTSFLGGYCVTFTVNTVLWLSTKLI